jgi:hypothetical protein
MNGRSADDHFALIRRHGSGVPQHLAPQHKELRVGIPNVSVGDLKLK